MINRLVRSPRPFVRAMAAERFVRTRSAGRVARIDCANFAREADIFRKNDTCAGIAVNDGLTFTVRAAPVRRDNKRLFDGEHTCMKYCLHERIDAGTDRRNFFGPRKSIRPAPLVLEWNTQFIPPAVLQGRRWFALSSRIGA